MYKYIGTKNGEVSEGIIDGASEQDVKRTLLRQDITPVSILPYKTKTARSFSFKTFNQNKKLNQTDIAFVTKQLALLVDSGKSLDRALLPLENRQKNLRYRPLLSDLKIKSKKAPPSLKL